MSGLELFKSTHGVQVKESSQESSDDKDCHAIVESSVDTNSSSSLSSSSSSSSSDSSSSSSSDSDSDSSSDDESSEVPDTLSSDEKTREEMALVTGDIDQQEIEVEKEDPNPKPAKRGRMLDRREGESPKKEDCCEHTIPADQRQRGRERRIQEGMSIAQNNNEDHIINRNIQLTNSGTSFGSGLVDPELFDKEEINMNKPRLALEDLNTNTADDSRTCPVNKAGKRKMSAREDIDIDQEAKDKETDNIHNENSTEASKDLTSIDVQEGIMEDSEFSPAEDEVDQMLEAPGNNNKEAVPAIEPKEIITKLVLEDQGQNVFEILPQGWKIVNHISGIPLYLHTESRVVTVSKPYDLGNGNVKRHNIPASAIPCYAYRYGKPGEKDKFENEDPSASTTTCNYAVNEKSPKSKQAAQSPESDFQNEDCPLSIFPKAHVFSIEEAREASELSPEEVTKYCKKLFKFKELKVMKFGTWKERRDYSRQSTIKKIQDDVQNPALPALPDGTTVITIPSLELSSLPGTEGESAINQRVEKRRRKEWIFHPAGKSSVALLHEYLQQSLKTQPDYQFTQLDNSEAPFEATVRIYGLEYGRGTGSTKKKAKAAASRKTLEMIIPEIKDKLPTSKTGEIEGDAPDLSFFDGIQVEDSRVSDLLNRTSEPLPYQVLVTCLQRNYGLGDTHIHKDLKDVTGHSHGKNEYTLRVNKRQVSVICKNKKEGKQLAAQKLLQQLHPHITSWGSLLRMYGNTSLRKLQMKKEEQTKVTALQTSSSASSKPTCAILNKLKKEMRNLTGSKQNVGKFSEAAAIMKTGSCNCKCNCKNCLIADRVDL